MKRRGKHPDFTPPAPVSVSKDYDDPTSILGRRFANVDHAPAFATLSTALGDMLTKTNASVAPDAAIAAGYQQSCERLRGRARRLARAQRQRSAESQRAADGVEDARAAGRGHGIDGRLRVRPTVRRWVVTFVVAGIAATLLSVVAVHDAAGQSGAAVVSPAAAIQHVVVIFQENVSFDHYFATYPHAVNPPGEPAFTPLPNTPPIAGLSGTLLTANPNATNPANGADAVNPYRLARAQAATADQDHSYTQEQIA